MNAQCSRTLPALVAHLICLPYAKHCSIRHPPLAPLQSPFLSPFSCDPCDLCSVTAQREDPMLRLPWQWPWRASVSRTHTHTSTDTLAYTLRQGRRSIFYYTEGSVGGVGGAMRVVLQWAHCRDTGEIRERVSVFLSKWQKECVCVWGSTGDCICHWTVVPESFGVSHSVERVLNAHRMLQSDLSVESLCHTVLCIIYLIFEVCGQ